MRFSARDRPRSSSPKTGYGTVRQDARVSSFRNVKGVLSGNSPLGIALYETLRVLVAGGILEEKPGQCG